MGVARTGGAGPRPRRLAAGLIALALVALLAPTLPWAPPASSSTGAASPAGAAGPADLAGSWSTFHGSENRSGFSLQDGPSAGSVLWDVAPPGATAFPIRSGLVVDPSFLYASDDLGTVFAFNRTQNGSIAWRHALGGTLTAGDRWSDELLVASSTGTLAALGAANGTARWVDALNGSVVQGVAAVGGTVYVATTAGWVEAVNASTGASVFQAPLAGPAAGSVALEGGTLLVPTTGGAVEAFASSGTSAGSLLWSASVGAPIATAVAVRDGRVLVADGSGNVSSLWLANGSLDWRWAGRSVHPGDLFESTPAVGDGRVFASSRQGYVTALSETNGSRLWGFSSASAGYPALASPALAPNGLYVCDAALDVVDLAPATGQILWTTPVGFVPSYAAPALDGGQLYVGTDLGSVIALGSRVGPPLYSVSGRVTDPNGTPIPAATVRTFGALNVTASDGSFLMALSNGTYALAASAPGYVATTVTVVVAGPVANISIVLPPVPRVWLLGVVVNARSFAPLAGATVLLIGSGLSLSTVSGSNGSFRFLAPVGPDFLTVSPPSGYAGVQQHVTVPLTGLVGLVVTVPPVVEGPPGWSFAAAVAAMLIALAVVGLWNAARRRAELGQPTRLFSAFAQYVTMRLLLLPAQVVAVLAILFLFGTMLPAAYFHVAPCAISNLACYGGGWENPLNPPLAFLGGFGSFVYDIFTGQWGLVSYGHLVEPATQLLAWWLPNSVELALFALPISAGLAYVVGLYVGARPDAPPDVSVRVVSTVALLTPTFLIALLFLGAFYDPFYRRLGDPPYGFLPSNLWFADHGGIPGWIGIADNTTPTSLPIVDGLLHGDGPFVLLVLMKTLWQALIISLVYVAIFLRFARHAVAEAFQEPYVRAARARGIDETTILWRHTGRRVVPLFLLVFGLTLPIYLGTQAIVEALANDPGVGTLLISEMTQVVQNGFGFHSVFPNQHPGSLYQVTIFALVFLVLLGNLAADVLARYLDPRLLRSRP